MLRELRNFTEAAERCPLSQPAFSALIRQLEGTVGTRLFDRDARNMRLTSDGHLLAESAARLLPKDGH